MFEKLRIEKKILIKVSKAQIPDDVLERIDGYEDFREDEYGNLIYHFDTFTEILNDKQDDISRTTRYWIKQFVNQVKKADYIMIVA